MSQTVFITGASSGIGRATAKKFAAQGWNVVATMRSPEKGADLGWADNVLVTRLDVEDLASIELAVEEARQQFGTIDVLINNAGWGLQGIFESLSREQIRQQFDVNVIGVMDVTRAVLPIMRKKQSGVIVNVSSRAGVIGSPTTSLYCSSKFALEGWSEAISFELAALGIAMKIVEPSGGITGTQFPTRTGSNATANAGRVPEEYGPFVEATMATFRSMLGAAKTSSEEVADVIYTAATDGTDRLRYVCGTDNPPLMKARREMSEEDYIRFVRSAFSGQK